MGKNQSKIKDSGHRREFNTGAVRDMEDGREIIIAPSNYASSQLCSNCGYKNPKVKNLALREWTCPKCGVFHDRDINASKNLLKLAI